MERRSVLKMNAGKNYIIGAGFQDKRYFLRGGYDFGLINPYKNADFVNGNHTRGRLDQWSIKLGVYLWYPD